MKPLIKEHKSKFLRVTCTKCKNEQVVFGKSATNEVKCLVCNQVLATSTGGKTNVTAKISEVMG